MKKYISLKKLLPFFLTFLFLVLLPEAAFSGGKLVAVMPWNVNSADKMDFLSDALLDMFSSRIGSDKEMEVVRADILKDALKEKGKGAGKAAITDKLAGAVGKKLKLDYVIYGSVTVLGNSVSLDVKLMDVKEGRVTPFFSKGTGVDSIISMADDLSGQVLNTFSPAPPPVPVPVKAPVATAPVTLPEKKAEATKEEAAIVKPVVKPEGKKPGRPEFWKSEKLKGHVISLAAADLDGNGVKEIFLLKEHSLAIAEIKDGKLEVKKEIKARGGVRFVSVTAIDSDGDGATEVYVSALRELKARSLAVEFKDGAYKETIRGAAWLLRKVRTAGAGGETLLIGQRFRDPDGFYGGLRALKKKGGALVDSGPFGVRLPRGVDIYRFSLFNFNSKDRKELDLVALDKKGRVRVYRKNDKGKWKEYWKSKESYGGSLNLVEFTEDTSGAETYRYTTVESGLLHLDTDGDGAEELIIKRNKPGGPLKGFARIIRTFSGGAVMSLSWDGEFLTEKWKTKEVNGYISDFLIEDLAGGGPEVVMAVVEGTGMLSGSQKSYVIVYRPGT